MIKARHFAPADALFGWYLGRLFRAHFHSFHLLGSMPRFESALPLLLYPNHSTWWDGFFIHYLNRVLFHRRTYLMMLEEQLVHHSFFRYVGAFSIDPASLAAVRRSLEFCLSILSSSRPVLLCIFPQGELLPWDRRPLDFKGGVGSLLKRHPGRINLCPLAIRIEFKAEQRPEVYFQLGENRIVDGGTRLAAVDLEKRSEGLLDELGLRIRRNESGRILFRGRRSLTRGTGEGGGA